MSAPLAALDGIDPWPCHRKPRKEWCDRSGKGDFMGHTCIPPKAPEAMLFLEWFVDQYGVGLPDPVNFAMCQAYLQGMLDTLGPDDNRGNLIQCLSTLRSAEVMARTLKQYQVRMPHG